MLISAGRLSEYDVRRPLTAIGTNLLGLVKHLATWEARYLGEIRGRPFPEPLGRWQDADGSDLWVTPARPVNRSSASISARGTMRTRRSRSLPSTLPATCLGGRGPDVKLFNIMVHVLGDTTRHAGHADILREQLDGRTGGQLSTRNRSTWRPVRPTR